MALIEEVCFSDNVEMHQKNMCIVKHFIKVLTETVFDNRLDLLRDIIITNNLEKTIKEHGYVTINPTAQALTHLVDGKYDVIVNYNNLNFDNEAHIKDVESYLYHEFQHVSDHQIYNEIADKYMLQYEPKCDFGKTLFFEFRAAYYAQLYTKREQTGQEYIRINELGWKRSLNSIVDRIGGLQTENTELAMKQIQELNKVIFEFNKDVMYHLILACGENLADNITKKGTKRIDVQVVGLNNQLDQLINEYISVLNEVLESDNQTIEFFIKNGLIVFEHLCSLVKLQLK